MIEQRNIVEKDFSLALPNTSRKLLAVGAALAAALEWMREGPNSRQMNLLGSAWCYMKSMMT